LLERNQQVPEEILQKRTINPHEKVTLSADNPKVILKLDYSPSVKHLVTTQEELRGQNKIFTIHNQSNFLVYAQLVKHP